MAKRVRYRWQNLHPEVPVGQVNTRRVEPNPGWRKIRSKRENECSCGCGGKITLGMPIMWDRRDSHVLLLDCARRMGILP